MARFDSDTLAHALSANGYAVVRACLSPIELADLLALIEARLPNAATYYERSATGSAVLTRAERLLTPRDLHEQTWLARSLGALGAAAFGEPAVLFKDKLNFKPPGGRGDKLHQDMAAGWRAYAPQFLTACFVLDPNTIDNGAMRFSQALPKATALRGDEWHALMQQDFPHHDVDGFETLLLDPGDVVFLDAYVPHGSPPNRTQAPRRNLFVTVNALSAGDQSARYYADKWASLPPNTAATARPASSHRV